MGHGYRPTRPLPAGQAAARLSRRIGLVLVALLLLPPVGDHGDPASAATGAPRPDLAAWFVDQINGHRAAAGHARVVPTTELTRVAARWAAELARRNVLSHNPQLATSITGWHYLGENVGVGYSATSLAGAFWASAPHRSNIVDPHYTQIGVAVVDVAGKLWVVEDFSRPFGPARETAKAPKPLAHQSPRTSPVACAVAVQAGRLFRARHDLRSGLGWPQTSDLHRDLTGCHRPGRTAS